MSEVFVKIVVPILCWFVAMAILATFGNSISDTRARTACESFGLNSCTVVDKHVWFTGFHGCGAGDIASFDVKAERRDGKASTLNVCCGWFKGCTVRTP